MRIKSGFSNSKPFGKAPFPISLTQSATGASAARAEHAVVTLSIRTIVFSTMSAMMNHSNVEDITIFHTRYWKLPRTRGMKRVSGLADMAKSMQARCVQEDEAFACYLKICALACFLILS